MLSLHLIGGAGGAQPTFMAINTKLRARGKGDWRGGGVLRVGGGGGRGGKPSEVRRERVSLGGVRENRKTLLIRLGGGRETKNGL